MKSKNLDKEAERKIGIRNNSSSIRGKRLPKGENLRFGTEAELPAGTRTKFAAPPKSGGFCAPPKTFGFRASPGRKGQFFIISAVIIASLLLMVSSNFSDFSNIKLAGNAEISELEYINLIKETLNSTAAASECDAIDESLSGAEGFIAAKLAKQGIEMSAAHKAFSCDSVKMEFNLSSQNFFSSTEFYYP